MAKFELLETVTLKEDETVLSTKKIAEFARADDPALMVMTDFHHEKPHCVSPDMPIDNALSDMKAHNLHLLLVRNDAGSILGILASEDILGEKPIQIMQERRIPRTKVLVKMIMRPLDKIKALELKTVERAKVGNIVQSLKELQRHYFLVFEYSENKSVLRGIFSTWQIARQMHSSVDDSPAEAQSLSELKKRASDE